METLFTDSQWMLAAVRPYGQRVVVVGAGSVGRRRAKVFAEHGAKVKMYDPHAPEQVPDEMPANIKFFRRRVSKKDLQNAWLVVVATNDPETNSTVGGWADELGLEVNRADAVDEGTFAVPALMGMEDGWQLAILGGDAGPMFSTWLKSLLAHVIGLPKINHVYNALAGARVELKRRTLPQQERTRIMRIVMSAALEAEDEIDGKELVRELLG